MKNLTRLLAFFLLVPVFLFSQSDDELDLQRLWEKTGLDYSWLGSDAGHNTDRGMAYNAATGHLLIPARQGTPSVRILEADTGDYVGELNLAGVGGGTFPINKIGVAEDGAIYIGNLTTDSHTENYRLYRWADESAVPVLVYSGDPSNGTPAPDNRFGDSIAVRGSGADTEIFLGTWTGTILARLTPGEDPAAPESYATQVIATDMLPAHGRNLVFGEGNILYSTRPSSAVETPGHLYEMAVDVEAGTATTLRVFDGALVARGLGPIGFDPAASLFASVRPFSHDVFVYRPSQFNLEHVFAPRWSAQFGTSIANGNGVGEAIVVGNRIYALDTNNGILALELKQREAVVPGEIYWTNATEIRTVELDGENPRIVRGGFSRLIGIGIDPATHLLYYADDAGGTIGRMNLDGSGHEILFSERANPQGLRVHDGQVYWAEWNAGLYAASVDTLEVEQLIDLGAGMGSTAVIIGADGTVYLGTTGGSIYAPSGDPANPTLIRDGLAPGSYGYAIHPATGTGYATSYNQNQIYSFDLGGGAISPITFGDQPLGIDITADGSQLVWAERGGGRILSAPVGSPATVTELVAGEDSPFGIVAVPDLLEQPVTFADWIAQFDLEAGEQGAEADPDGDGVSNLLEYALAGDPTVPGTATLPRTEVVSEGGNDYLALIIDSIPLASGISFVVEVSSDLQTWETGDGHIVALPDVTALIAFRDAMTIDSAPRRFMRLRVNLDE